MGFLVGTHHTEEAESCLELKNGLRTVANGAGSALSVDFPATAWMNLNMCISLCSLNIKHSLTKSSLKPGMDKYLKVINTQLSNYLEWSKGYNDG